MVGFRVLLLHPEPGVRALVRAALAEAGFLKVLGEAVTAFEALELIEAIPYSVLFLGLDLPGGVSGLELAQMLSGRKRKPALVFIADDEGAAFGAYELGAADYLLWPASRDRLKLTFEKLGRLLPSFKQAEDLPSGPESGAEEDEEEMVRVPLAAEDEDRFISALRQAWDVSRFSRPMEIEKLAITLDGRTILLPYTQVVFVEAYEDYSFVHTATQKFLTSYRLKNLEDRLRPHRFFRAHRKYLVNLDMVTEIASLPGGNFMLRTAGKTRIELPIGRRRVAELKQILGL